MILFEIDTTDYTRHILVPTYQVNRLPVYTSWIDGNNVQHRDINRYRISGSFAVYFDSIADQLAFFAKLESSRTAGGYVPVQLYANNTNAVYTANVYIDATPKNDLPLLGNSDHEGINIKIQER